MKRISLCLLSAWFVLAPLSASAKGKKHLEHKEKNLYERLGKMKAINAVVDEFVGNCANDQRISSFFQKTAADPKRLAAFKRNLSDQICEAAGGPCHYKGKGMKEAHAGMGIKEEHFNALVEDLTKALDKFHVAEKDKGELLGVLGPMKPAIVEGGTT